LSATVRHSQAGQGRPPAAFTIATIPARTGSGRPSQRSATNAKSADFRAKSAKQNAKSFWSVAEVLDWEYDASRGPRF
jgi:hypothetical protein